MLWLCFFYATKQRRGKRAEEAVEGSTLSIPQRFLHDTAECDRIKNEKETEMAGVAKIGVVLAGGASKGAYELGVMAALRDYFGMNSIRCVSTSSIGALVAQAFGMGRGDELTRLWKGLDTRKHGRFFLAYSGNKSLLSAIDGVIDGGRRLAYEHYVTVWNYTGRRVEYIPFHTLMGDRLKQYLRGAIAIPLFSGGEVIDGNRILDGALLDNIPAYPLVQKELDYIFCIYFDNCNYLFENEQFDRKIIKLSDFPNHRRLEVMRFDPEAFEEMVRYGYRYTMGTVEGLFAAGREREAVYAAIQERERTREPVYKPRLTADVVVSNINAMTKRFAKRLSKKEQGF